jgi:DNA repair exonuclease SbcCD ATPase subunit
VCATEIKYQERKAARQMLWCWGNYVSKINRLEIERAEAQKWADEARETLHAQNLSGMPGSGKKTDLADVVASVERMEANYRRLVQQIETEISDLIRLRNCIEELVAQLSPVQEKIISYRYIDGHHWQFIAMKTRYDERQARRIETEAVDFIAKHIQIEKKEAQG